MAKPSFAFPPFPWGGNLGRGNSDILLHMSEDSPRTLTSRTNGLRCSAAHISCRRESCPLCHDYIYIALPKYCFSGGAPDVDARLAEASCNESGWLALFLFFPPSVVATYRNGFLVPLFSVSLRLPLFLLLLLSHTECASRSYAVHDVRFLLQTGPIG